jgi:hypothetical protein
MFHAPSGATYTVYFPLVTAGSTSDFLTGATFAAGDCKIIKDGAAGVNTTNLPTEESHGWYSLVVTQAEMTSPLVNSISIIDQGTKVWDDQGVIIETTLMDKLATILADTNELQSDDVPGLIGALNDLSENDVWDALKSGHTTVGSMAEQFGTVDNSDLINRNAALIESQRGGHTFDPVNGTVFYVDPVNGDTHANGARGGISDPYSLVQDCHDNAVTDSAHDVIILVPGASAGPTTLTEDVTITKRYLFIRGPGRDFYWTRSGNGDTITVTSADGIEFSGFQVNTAVTGVGNGIAATDADFLNVHHCWFNDTQGDGIHLDRCSNAQITDNHYQDTGVGGTGHGIEINGTGGVASNCHIERNMFEDVQGDGIRLIGGTIENTLIAANKFSGSSGYAVNLQSAAARTIVCENNWGNNTSGDLNDSGTNTIDVHNVEWAYASVATEARLAELDAANLPSDVDDILADTGTTIPATLAGLNDISANDVWTHVVSEPMAIGDVSHIGHMMWAMYGRWMHKHTQTATTQTLYNSGNTTFSSASVTDDSVTETVNKHS